MIGFIRLREQRKALGMLFPRELSPVDDEAADRCAMSADVFRCGIDDDCRAMFERPSDQRSRGVVGNKWNAKRPPDVSNLFDREDVELGIGEDLGVISAR